VTGTRLPVVDDESSWFRRNQNQDASFRVGLVHPYLPEASAKNRLKYRESLALGYLTAALEASGYEVASINAEFHALEPGAVAERLLGQRDIGLVGISAKSQRTYRAAKVIAQRVKAERPDVHITVGGVFPSAADHQLLGDCAHIDSVVRGEGEHAIVELAGILAGGQPLASMRGLTYRGPSGEVIRTPERRRIQNLDALPFPARRDLEDILAAGGRGASSAYLVASRGCYARCTFCSIHQIYGDHQVVRRSAGSIVDEMAQLGARYGIRRFSFVDDLFIMPSKRGIAWVHEFCDELERRELSVNFYAEMRADTVQPDLLERLLAVGLHRIFIGAEAGSDEVLQRWDKGTKVADNDAAVAVLRGLNVPAHAINFGYIMFDPEITVEELRKQYGWLKGSGICKVQHLQNKMNIYWGTPQHARMLAQGRKDTAAFGDRWIYEFDDPVVGAFEGVVRRFVRRMEAEHGEAMATAREAFMTRMHEDETTVAVPDWLADVYSQALRRVDQLERDCYYHVFDRLFYETDRGSSIDGSVEAAIWRELQPALDVLDRECDLLRRFAEGLPDLRIAAGGAEFTGPPVAWRIEGGPAVVWLDGEVDGIGYAAARSDEWSDRYDHRSAVVRLRQSPAGPALCTAPDYVSPLRTDGWKVEGGVC
jgi:radical SAM superfamily enzyme YgiQ (UPF0313 family)